MSILQAENLSFAAGHVALLDKASFQLESGEKVGLIGRNGAGKSSLLKILAGVQKADEGRLILQNGLKTVYVPQESFFNPTESVFDVVAEGLGGLRGILRRYHCISRELESGTNDALLKALHEVQIELEAQNGWQFDAAIKQAVSELGLPENELIGNLSGGQKKRVALAQAWVQKPDILLLDEPTNHLDINAIIWLENLLKAFEGSIVVITHDRRFLDNIAERIVELDRGILRSYFGSFSKYSEKKAQELAVEAEHNRLFDKFHAQEEAWIRKGIEARRTRNEGRVRRLEELRRQRAERRNVQGRVNFKLDSGGKSGKIIAELEHASFQYGGKIIIDKFSTVIQRGDKIGLIGPNGIGKTTFLRLILGELQPSCGRIRIGSKQEVAYFDQFRSALNENDTVFYTLGQGNDYVEVGGKKKHVMSYLEDFLFHPARAQSPVSSLSGGERNRLLLAKLFTKPANILVLDEPTNDLDIETQELLEELLRDYQGTVFLVSHDRAFLDNVITQSIVFEGKGRLKEYIGGYEDYLDAKKREQSFQTASDTKIEKPPANIDNGRKANRTAKLSYKEQRELDALPEEITTLENEQAEINEQLSAPEVFKNYEKAGLLQARAEAVEILLQEKLERWEILENKKNSAG
ncbi:MULTISPECIES: ATP-binding cassette domain-containing protein [unclassified Neisseria]|uniref:ATP-binding cassette domain-containing protein n=1 Tax=unclassified Neisseria TaxID=2623750 RepID=UPI0010726973|nr:MULTISPECIES: ATP-binding cassette domain-containing protein [unclassified Neisseria]MBF0802804.1 ATP-binding cassette domain-containing protein [Neisseria sp. 19428wB4_WF04]TFU44598.1 ATP-binding cassette domain-containing protein [Neisseria sp. WF04]